MFKRSFAHCSKRKQTPGKQHTIKASLEKFSAGICKRSYILSLSAFLCGLGLLCRLLLYTNDLALIDGGGYSAEVTLPVASYATAEDNTQEEIPGTGIPVYVKAWVEAPVNAMAGSNEYDTVNEYFQGNNTTSLTLDNLAVRRDEDVTLQSTIDNSGDATSVTVDVQYNKLTGTASGNLIVTLLDANGQPLEKLQSYTQKGGLLTLSEEGSATEEFTFSQKGADVRVEFSDLILDGNSVELDHVSLTGANVTYDPDTKTYTATGAGLTSGILDIAPKDPDAAITLDGAPYDATAVQSAINLNLGRKEWTIVVSNGGKSETYKLVLNNADPESGEVIPVTGVSLNKSSIELTPGETEHLTATIAPANATIRDLIWTSNDTKIATVDSNGNITAVSTGTTAITAITADGGYTATCVVTVSSTEMKVEIKNGITAVPEAFKNLENLNTPEKITTAMRTAITQLGIPSGNTAVYDVTLMVNDGSGWKKADASNFPAGGLTVTLPYPNGTNSSYRFKVVHMFTTSDFGKTPGATETPAVTNTADGIRFTVTGLSPISVGWTAADPEKPTIPDHPGTDSGSSGSSSYAVTVTKPEHGKVTVSPTSASSGNTVTLTVTPDSGYVLDTLTVTDSRGNEIKLTARGDGKYTFTMPGRAVTVKATFTPLPGDAEKPCDGGADCPSRAFTDLGSVGTWYHEAVDYALRNNLMGGYGNDLFGPNNNLTRAQLA